MALFRTLLIALLALCPLGFATEAFAQSAVPIVTSSCGSQSLTATRNASPYEDTTGKLCTASSASLSGTTSNASSGVATSSTNVPTVSYNYGFNGTTWDQLQVDGSKFLKVDIAAGGLTGSTSNAGSAVTTSSTNLPVVNYNYGFNGTTWDQLQVDTNKSLKDIGGSTTIAHTCSTAAYTRESCLGQIDDDIKGPIAAGSNVIGGVTVASGGLAAGSVSAGAYVSGSILSGAYASGSISSGADVTEGTTSPTVTCSTTWTVNGCLAQLHTDATSAIPAGTNVIGVTGVAQGSTTSGQSGELVQGAVTTANPANTTAQTSPLSETITGALRTVNAPGTMETCTSGNVANATVACTLATSAGHTTFIAGFVMNSNGATAGTGVTCTLTGVITGTMSFTYDYGAIASITNAPLFIQFNPPIPASAANTTVVASCPAGGTGATLATMNAWGFQQ